MSSYVAKILLPGERVEYVALLHWVVYARGMAITIGGGVLGFFSPTIAAMLFGPMLGGQAGRVLSGIAMGIVLIGIGFLIAAYMKQTSTELVVTDARVIAKYGIVSRTTFEIMLNRVTGANFDQTVAGRILGYGTILVHGAGGEISPIDLVTEPQTFQRALVTVLERAQKRATV